MPVRRRQSRSTPRRQAVLDAALGQFADKGIAQASIEDIGRIAGASVGSIYHQFGSKAGIVAAVYLDALADFQHALTRRLASAVGAREGLRAIVAAHAGWVDRHPGRARFLLEMRRDDAVAAHDDEILACNREFAAAFGRWVAGHVQSGALRPLPPDLLMAQLLGPTHEYLRGRLGGRVSTPLRRAVNELAEAAWRALGADPPPMPTPPPRRP